jgi:signal recognition particle GTPase
MSDEQPTQGEPQKSDIAEELRALGQNLRDMLRTAWESPERKKVQEEIESGLTQLGDTVNKAVNEFSGSKTGQTLKADVDDLSQRIRTGEVENKVREEIIKVLRMVNSEFGKASKETEKSAEEPPKPPDSGAG